MATDQATADYEREQEKRAVLQDDRAQEWEIAIDSLKTLIDCWGKSALFTAIQELPDKNPPVLAPVTCDRCDHWESERDLHLTNGTTQTRAGFCTARAAADLPQMPKKYAESCHFFKEDLPF